MPFAYYKRLSARQKRIYDSSDAVSSVLLPSAGSLGPLVAALARALHSQNRTATQRAAEQLTAAVLQSLKVPGVRVRVLAARPSRSWGELHGLYEPEAGHPPLITVWMRTAQRRQVVAFKTFLRTLLHEIVHHLDYELLKLEDSLHTEGFYKRESSFFHQLVPDAEIYEPARRASPKRASAAPQEAAGVREAAVHQAAGGGEKPQSQRAGARRRRQRVEQAHLPFGDS